MRMELCFRTKDKMEEKPNEYNAEHIELYYSDEPYRLDFERVSMYSTKNVDGTWNLWVYLEDMELMESTSYFEELESEHFANSQITDLDVKFYVNRREIDVYLISCEMDIDETVSLSKSEIERINMDILG